MAGKQVQTLRDMGNDELTRHVEELQEELFNLRFRNKMRQLDNSLKIRETRRQIARALTLLRNQELESQENDK